MLRLPLGSLPGFHVLQVDDVSHVGDPGRQHGEPESERQEEAPVVNVINLFSFVTDDEV